MSDSDVFCSGKSVSVSFRAYANVVSICRAEAAVVYEYLLGIEKIWIGIAQGWIVDE